MSLFQLINTMLNNNNAVVSKPVRATPAVAPSQAAPALMVYDHDKRTRLLAPALAQGGEGTVYPMVDRPDVLVKIYHPDVLVKNRHTLQQKIEVMLQMKELKQNSAFSWPLLSVFDAQNQWIGYAMYRKQGPQLHCIAHAVLYKKYYPQLNRRDITLILLDLIQQVQYLHEQGVMIGDYNLHNFLCDIGNKRVYFIDCDSYQIQVNGQLFPCLVGSPDLTPVEHHQQAYSQIVRTPTSESFSVALILFKCLMLGRHPYDVVGGEDPVHNLCNGNFPYGKGNKGIPCGPWYNIWSHMPYLLKTLFIQTFQDGATQPQKRPSLKEWHKALSVYLKEIDKGYHMTEIQPRQPKATIHRGSNGHATS